MATTPVSTSASTSTPTVSPSNFAVSLLQALDLPVNQLSVALIVSWQAKEGQWNATVSSASAEVMHNPLNTRTNYTTVNGTGISCPDGAADVIKPGETTPCATISFPTWQDGIDNTAAFIQKNDPDIITALQATSGPDKETALNDFVTAVEHWNPVDSNYGQEIGALWQDAGGLGIDQGAAQAEGTAGLLPIPTSIVNVLTAANPSTYGKAALSGATAVGKAVTQPLDSVDGLISAVSSKSFWSRIGWGALGVILCLVGLAFIGFEVLGGSKAAQDAGTAGLAAVAA